MENKLIKQAFKAGSGDQYIEDALIRSARHYIESTLSKQVISSELYNKLITSYCDGFCAKK
jgi:hypothetical protein